jgi:putative ABC transport system permease protein
MNTVTLSLGHLRQQGIAGLLHVTVLALGIAGVSALAMLGQLIEQRLQADARGVDLVVAAPGSPLQIILATVFHVDQPTGNIPLEATRWLQDHPLVARSIPLALGDSHAGFRIVGTTHDLIGAYGGTLASGVLWTQADGAVLGAQAAAETGMAPGDRFVGVHGISSGLSAPVPHPAHPYRVEGILEPTGSVLDRLILVSVDSVWRIHRVDRHWSRAADPGVSGDPTATDGEITAVLITYRSPLAAAQLPSMVNRHPGLQAASPAYESARLFSLIAPVLGALHALALVLIGLAAIGLVSAQVQALLARRHELALLRALGSTRSRLARLVVCDSLMLGSVAALLGLGLAGVGVHLLGTGVPVLAGPASDTAARLLGIAGPVLAGTLALSCLAAATLVWLACRDQPTDRLERGVG